MTDPMQRLVDMAKNKRETRLAKQVSRGTLCEQETCNNVRWFLYSILLRTTNVLRAVLYFGSLPMYTIQWKPLKVPPDAVSSCSHRGFVVKVCLPDQYSPKGNINTHIQTSRLDLLSSPKLTRVLEKASYSCSSFTLVTSSQSCFAFSAFSCRQSVAFYLSDQTMYIP